MGDYLDVHDMVIDVEELKVTLETPGGRTLTGTLVFDQGTQNPDNVKSSNATLRTAESWRADRPTGVSMLLVSEVLLDLRGRFKPIGDEGTQYVVTEPTRSVEPE